MNIISRHSISNFAHHDGIHSLFDVEIWRLRNSIHQKEAFHNKLIRELILQNLESNESKKSEQNLIENVHY